MTMLIFPAIDLRNGQCVRLLYGDPNAQTTYSDDPAAIAERFVEDGAEWLHVVNLDGAFDDKAGAQKNLTAIQSILDRVDVPIQVGGGIRTIEDIEIALDMGVTRVILGTLAVDRPRQVLDIVARFGPTQIIVGIDLNSADGRVTTHGWRNVADIDGVAFGKQMRSMGITHALCTDISRDGALTGANLEICKLVGEQSGLQVIVSGGVASLEDVRQAKLAARSNIHGVIIGRALYTGDIKLPDAIAAAH
jgi:phosphoribosylformimino-5-aminoimidazole carboxamide ribotide isomerase